MTRNLRLTLSGIGIGILGNLVGFLVYGLVLSQLKNVTFSYFYKNMFLGTDVFKSQIITGALLVNVLIFYIFMRKRMDELSRGILITILFSVIAIVYYYT